MSIVLEEQYNVDEEKEIQGVWVDEDGTQLLIAGSENPNVAKAMQELPQEVQDMIREGEDPAPGEPGYDKMAEAVAHIASKALLLGWEDLYLTKDEEVPYSPEKCKEILTNYRKFRDRVWVLASQYGKFMKD